MSKTLRKVLVASSAILMLAGVGATANNGVSAKRHHARTHRVYRSHWYKGAPKVLRHNSQWLSNPSKATNGRTDHYVRNITPMGGKYGFNPTPFYFNSNHHYHQSGADSSATLAVNAHTKALGHGWYRVRSGAEGIYITATVKVHSRNSISIWANGQYYGHFHRMSNRKAHHFYYHPYF